MPTSLILEKKVRTEIWQQLVEAIENYTENVSEIPISPDANQSKIRALLATFDFKHSIEPQKALEFALFVLHHFQNQNPHPRYLGLFDPAPSTMSIMAETIVAAFNPQLSLWGQSPGAVEIEQFLVKIFGEKFGYAPEDIDGTFTSGGAEANHTAVLTALTHRFPGFTETGLRGLSTQPVAYISAEGHHSVKKAIKACGLGAMALREITVDEKLRMKTDDLLTQIYEDRANGLEPFLIVGTAGTTNAGMIDPLTELAEASKEENVWFHVDAAWGGAIALVPDLKDLLKGIERADSITFDPHKLLSVSRGAGMYLTRHPEILNRTFDVAAAYMPRSHDASTDVVDQFKHSMQWSRRFTGLKLFLTLAVTGWDGYAEIIRQHIEIGNYLKQKLKDSGWAVLNNSLLGVVCFVDEKHKERESANYLEKIRQAVIETGNAWISTTRLGKTKPALRACITNFKTTRSDIDLIVKIINEARSKQVEN